MLITETEKLKQDIATWVQQYGGDRGSLMPVLQEIQRKYNHINEMAMQWVADMLGIHPVEVHGVVSFYSFLSSEPQGRFVIRLCRTITCDMAGKDQVARQLENDLGISFGQTTHDRMFTLEWANCLGMCDQGPAMLVNDRVYTRVTPEQIYTILEECRGTLSPHAMEHKQEHIV